MDDVSRRQRVELLRWRVRRHPAGGLLPFANGVHDLYAGNRTAGCSKGLEPQHRPRQSLHRPMVLLHKIVEIFALPDGDPSVVNPIVLLNRGGVTATLVNGDRLWEPVMTN